jgi:peptidoglycan LD-endopeptidase LytH
MSKKPTKLLGLPFPGFKNFVSEGESIHLQTARLIPFINLVKKLLLLFSIIILNGCSVYSSKIIPVDGATKNDWNPNTYLAHPWSKSKVHKGIDIFAEKGTPVISSRDGFIFKFGPNGRGGNSVFILGYTFKIHYYAHLDEILINKIGFIKKNKTIGTVGDSGNAKGKSPHLHYAILSPIPYFWNFDNSISGWKKMFYLNPEKYIVD